MFLVSSIVSLYISDISPTHSGTCACLCDCGVLKDEAFHFWGIICCCAMLTFYVPFILIVPYLQFEFRYGYLDALRFICVFCASSIVSRVLVFYANDFTFTMTRLFFQAGLAGELVGLK